MRVRILPKVFPIRFLLWVIGIMGLGILGPMAALALQETPTGIQPDAAHWSTWVLESGSQLRLPPPPDEAATAEEIAQLMEMSAQLDDDALQQIAYWNSGPPSYRWNQIAVDAMIARGVPIPMALRHLALVHVAIYDATVAAWDSKYAYERPRPTELEPALPQVIPTPQSPSYPSEYAVTAGAASTVLAWLFPDAAQSFEDAAQVAVNSRLLAGVEYPSDVEAGLELGRQVAQRVIERGNADGFSAAWTGSVPTEAGLWTGENPLFVTAGTWQPWVLTSPDQFRPGPPPAYNSEQELAEMDELRTFERTPVTSSLAMFWEFGAGGRRGYWLWNDITSRSILESRWHDNAPLAARAYALTNIAGYDATVACFDAKYTYWAMRPFQIDPEFAPLFSTPGHPAYPSAHSCISTATTEVLAYLFPVNADGLRALAQEAGESRIWAGIHFRSDIEAGSELGQNVADAVIAHAMRDSTS